MSDYRSLPLSAELSSVLAELGYTALTPIQAQAIPVLLQGRDLIGQSQTGSGKTLAFCVPILERMRFERQAALQALVLCPTRELSAQVARELRRLGRAHAGLRVLTLTGGAPVRAQALALERGVHAVVGTPGRVLDHLRRGSLQLHGLSTLVLDEADRMLDMGFEADMEQILQHTPSTRQTVFFSATFLRSVALLSEKYQREPERITIAAEATEKPAVAQRYVLVEPAHKLATLIQLLRQQTFDSALVFANQRATVDEICAALGAAKISAGKLHGELQQVERDLVLARFRNGSTRVLVATDVAARGIDVSGLDLVVNFDLPTRFDLYLHRVGRTGRAGQVGSAFSLVTAAEEERIGALEQAHGFAIEATELSPLAATEAQPAAMETLRISGGRKQKLRASDILGALTGEAAGLAGDEIGKIEIHDDFSYVAVVKHKVQQAQRGLSTGRIKGRRFRVSSAFAIGDNPRRKRSHGARSQR
jgi:ATP-independent RNA helicase DbpA